MLLEKTDPQALAKIREFGTMGEMWTHCVAQYGHKPVILDNGKTYSYAQIDADIARFRGVLAARGIGKGDRVAVYMRNSYDFVKAYLAITTFGAVAVLLPPHLDETAVYGSSLKYALKGLVSHPETADSLALAREKNPGLALMDIADDADPAPMGDLSPQDPCAILFTGGTTGRSKGAMLSHLAVMTGTRNGCYGYGECFDQRYYLVLPLTHVFGLIRNLMTTLFTGSQMAICRNNKDMFKEMLVFQPTILVFVPALAEMALNLSKQFGRNMLGDSVRAIICGAATVPPYLKKEYKHYGVTLYAGYGLTESTNLTSANPEPERKADSIGVPYPGQEIKIVDGELWLKGPNMMMGYVGEEDANAAAYAEDGWFKTGDLVRQDEEGFLYVVGRIKELIVLPSGENISPAEYENRFNQLDLIQDSLIYEAVEDGRSMLVLEVLPRQNELAKLEAEDKEGYIKDQLSRINQTLPSFARVSKIIVRDKDFKRSPNMKILRDQK